MLDNTTLEGYWLARWQPLSSQAGAASHYGIGKRRLPAASLHTGCVHVPQLQPTPPPLPTAGLDVSTLHEAMQLIGGRQIETEASGNVTLETIR